MTTNYKPQKEIYAPLPCWGWNIKWVSNIRLIFLTGNCKADLYFSMKKNYNVDNSGQNETSKSFTKRLLWAIAYSLSNS